MNIDSLKLVAHGAIRLTICILIFLWILPSHAQDQLQQKADSFFREANYGKAISTYSAWLEKNDYQYDSTYLENLRKYAQAQELLLNFPGALNNYAKVERLSKILKNKQLEISSALNIGDLYRKVEQFDKSKAKLHSIYINPTDSIRFIELVNRKYHRLAATNQEMGILDSTIFYSNRALSLSLKYDLIESIPVIQNEKGFVFENKSMFDSAIIYYKKAIDNWQHLGDLRYSASGSVNLIRAYQKNDQPDLAIALSKRTLTKIRNKKWSKLESELYFQLLVCYREKNMRSTSDSFRILFLEKRLESITKEDNKDFIRAHAEYDLAIKEQEKAMALLELAYQKKKANYYVIGLILLSLLITVSTIFLINTYKKKAILNTKNEEFEQMIDTNSVLFSIIGHDLRSPLNSLTGLIAILTTHENVLTPDEMNTYFEKINRQTKNLNLLLDNLLSWSLTKNKQLPIDKKKINISSLISRNLELFHEAADSKSIAIYVKLAEQNDVYADEKSLDTVIRNLLNNAIKFTPFSGIIEISAKNEGDFYLLSIKDSGLGITKEKIDSLFEKQINKSTKGTGGEKGSGLGLVLSQSLLEINKGIMKVKSEIGQGATFTICLPIKKLD